MVGDRTGLGGLGAPRHDRFARWPQAAARAVLAFFLLLAALAAVAPGYAPPPPPVPKVTVRDAAGHMVVRQEDDNDLRLYRRIIARVRAGENYYHAAVSEQRSNNYPVIPGFTVRLPTMAVLAATLGDRAMIGLGLVLLAAMLLALWRRVMGEAGGAERMPMAVSLALVGLASGLNFKFDVLHEIWAAKLIVLSVALHRPREGRWGWSWLVAAAGLAVRELVLPYVLLMGAMALWRRRMAEAGAWLLLVVLFGAALALHLHLAAAQVQPGDPVSPPWLVLSGISGWLYKINNSTLLYLLPVWLSGPVLVAALLGWAGWRTPLGALGFLLSAGYAVMFMIAGRDNNFYWGLLISPMLLMGAAFLPISLPSLWRAAGLGSPGRSAVRA